MERALEGEFTLKNSDMAGSKNKTFTVKKERKVTNSKTMTQQYTKALGTSVSISLGLSLGFPILSQATASISASTEYRLETMHSETTSDTSELSLNWEFSGEVPPGYSISCGLFGESGKFTSGITSTVELVMADERKFSIKQSGEYHSVGWSRSINDCKTLLLSQAPANAAEADDEEVLNAALAAIG